MAPGYQPSRQASRSTVTMAPIFPPPQPGPARPAPAVVQHKTVAKPRDARQMIVSAMRFGEPKFPRGMLFSDIVEILRGAYIVPSSPTFNNVLTNALAHLVARGTASKVNVNTGTFYDYVNVACQLEYTIYRFPVKYESIYHVLCRAATSTRPVLGQFVIC